MPTNNSINSQDPIQVSKGGTGQSTLTTANGILAAGTSATGAIQNIGTGSAGQVLTSNGTSLPSFQAAPTGAMVLLHTITFNNTAANYDITPYVTGYDIYKFFISNLPTVTANAIAGLQFSTNGGSTWITTGYIDWGQFFLSTGIQGAGVTDMVRIGPFNGGSGYLAQSETMMSGYGGSNGAIVQTYNANVYNGQMISNIESGVLLTASLNGIRLTNTTGTNFPSGKFSIYGIAT